MALDLAGLVISLAVLAVSGDQFILAIARIAQRLQIRPTVIGAVVGGFGTSIAELIVAALATLRHLPELAVGSLVGSVVANVCLGLAVAALISPVYVDSMTVRREAPLSVASVALFAGLAASGMSSSKGAVLALALVPALGVLLLSARHHGRDELGEEVVEYLGAPPPAKSAKGGREATLGLVSLLVMLGGAELMVRSTVGVASHLGMAQGYAGLTLVGIGTSAPLIASSIQAARRNEHDLVVGNVLGGNMFIALCGGALVGLLARGSSLGVSGVSLVLMVGVVVASWLAMARGNRLSRWEAIVLIAAYAVILPLMGR